MMEMFESMECRSAAPFVMLAINVKVFSGTSGVGQFRMSSHRVCRVEVKEVREEERVEREGEAEGGWEGRRERPGVRPTDRLDQRVADLCDV